MAESKAHKTEREQAEHDRQVKLADKAQQATDLQAVDAARVKAVEAEHVALAKQPLVVIGEPGGPFNIRSSGLGPKGSITIGGIPAKITRWDDMQIRGVLPVGATGDVAVNGIKRGTYPHPNDASTTEGKTLVQAGQMIEKAGEMIEKAGKK